MHNNKDGDTHIATTPSQALTQTQRRYSVAELRFLVIVYALDKFRIYIFGYEVYFRTDNKA